MKRIYWLLSTLLLFSGLTADAQYRTFIIDPNVVDHQSCNSDGCSDALVTISSLEWASFASPTADFNTFPIGSPGVSTDGHAIYMYLSNASNQQHTISGITLSGYGDVIIGNNAISFNSGYAFIPLPHIPDLGIEIQGFFSVISFSFNSVPLFIAGDSVINICDVHTVDFSSLLHIADMDPSQPLTWSVTAPPAAGTLTFTGGAATSGGTDIAPSGTFLFTPPSNPSSQQFTVMVTDGLDTAYRTIIVNTALTPQVTSISHNSPVGSYANAIGNNVTYQVNFNTLVTGVDASDFLLTTTGGVTGTIGSISGSGSTYLVPVNSLTGDGTARLDLKSTGTGITAGLCNVTGGFTAGQSYIIDHTAPVVSSVDVPAPGSYATGQFLDFVIHFNEVIKADTSEGVSTLAITLNTGGTVSARYISGNGTTDLIYRYVVGSSDADFDGITVGSSITLGNSILKDSAGNSAVRTLNNVGNTTAVLVNAIHNDAPVFVTGATTTIGVCPGTYKDITSSFAVADTNAGQYLTWSVISQPSRGGTLSTSGLISPTGSSPVRPYMIQLRSSDTSTTDTFRVRVSDGYAADTLTIYVYGLPVPPVTAANNSGSVCTGSDVTLSASGSTSYSWYPATALSATTGATVIASPTVTTTYIVTASNGICTDTAQVLVSILSLPSVVMDNAVAVCEHATSAVLPFRLATDSVTFNFNGFRQTYTVPPHVDSVDLDVYGAAGGLYNGSGFGAASSGSGARVRARIPVTEGEVLNIFAGGTRFNGGATGSSNGGDASDVRIGGIGLADRVIVAGGGGGAGTTMLNGSGGSAGYPAGQPSSTPFPGYIANAPGTQSAGGRGGKYISSPGDTSSAGNGTLGNGGSGSGGGGGGGYYGGGGGANEQGGAGGSSWYDASVCNRVYTQSNATTRPTFIMFPPTGNQGDGFVIVNPILNATFTYTLQWNSTAISAGFSNVTGQPVPTGGSMNLSIPMGATPNTYNGTITISDGTCTSQSYPFQLTVKPVPVMSTPTADISKCAGDTTGRITFVAAPSNTVISWNNSNSAIGLSASGSGNIANVHLTNSGSTDLTGTVIVHSSLNGCNGNSDTFTITSRPTPTVNNPGSVSACNNDTVDAIDFTGSISSATYTWSNSTSAIGLATSGTGNILSFTANNMSLDAVSASITVTPAFSGCTGASQSFSITVTPTPNVYAITDKVLCAGVNTSITFSGDVSGTAYTWSNNNTSIGLSSTGSGNINSFNVVNNGTTVKTATVTVTPMLSSCSGSSRDFTITVNPRPSVNNFTDGVYCNAAAVSATTPAGSGVSGTQYTWSNSNSEIGLATSGSGIIPAFTATNSGPIQAYGTVTVTPSANGCDGPAKSYTIYVNPQPDVTATSDKAACNAGVTDPILLSGTAAGPSYVWTNDNTAIGLAAAGSDSPIPSFTAVNNGTAPVTATIIVTPKLVLSGITCYGNADTFIYTVNPTPGVNTVTDTAVCNGEDISTISFSGEVSGTSYTWANNNIATGLATSGTGNIATFTGTNTGNTNAVSTVSVVPTANGCGGSVHVFSITVHPTPTVDSIANRSACNDHPVSGFSFNGTVSGTTYNWSNSNTTIGLASSGTNFISTFDGTNNSDTVATGIVTVTPVANGCTGNTRNFIVTIKPTATVNSVSDIAICNADNTSVINLSGPVSNTTFNWNNSDGSIGLATSGTGDIAPFNAANTGHNPVTATISVTPMANGCQGTTSAFTIRVNPTPVIAPVTDVTICNGSVTGNITFGTTGIFDSVTYIWGNDNTSINLVGTGASDINSFTAVNTSVDPATADIVVTPSARGCSGISDTFMITVNPTPQLTSPLAPAAICNNLAFHYTPGSATTGTTYAWSRTTVTGISNSAGAGNNDPAEVLTNTVAEPVNVTYVYTLTANNCTNTQSVTVAVNPTPMMSSTLAPSPVCDSSLFDYTPASMTTGTNYTWTRLTVTGIENAGTAGTGNPMEYLKNITPAPVNVQYVYTLTANGCDNEQLVTLTVYPTPLLSSTVTPSAICDSTLFSYHPLSLTTGTTYAWSRSSVTGISNIPGTSATDISENLDNTTPAPVAVTYVYTLTANGCSNQQNVIVYVNPTPMLSSSMSITPVCDSALVSYIPVSASSGTTFNWTRDTIAGISNSPAAGTGNPMEYLVNTIPLPITLQYAYVLSANGCSNTQWVSATINPKPLLSSTLTPPAICDSATFNYTPESLTSGSAFTWNRAPVSGIANTAATGTDNPAESLYNTTPDPVTVAYIYTLTAYGCTNSQQVDVVVNPTPKLNSLTAPAICNNTVFNYSPVSATAGTTFAWTRPSVSGINNPADTGVNNPAETLTNTTPDPVPVAYIYTLSANSCNFVQVVNTTVNPTPALSGTLSATVCSGAPFGFSPASATTGTAYTWIRPVVAGISNIAGSGSGTISETLLNTTLGPKVTTYEYTLTANGCTNQQALSVTVNPAPAAPVIAINSPADVCSHTMYQNFGAATNAPDTVEYNWSATGADIYAQGTGHRYSIVSFPASGTANIILTANATGFTCYSRDTFNVHIGNSEVNNAEIYYVHDHFIYIDNMVDHYQWGYDNAATLDSVMFTGQVDQNMYEPAPDFADKRYWVMVTRDDCQSKIYYNAPTGINQVETTIAAQIKVFPNPAGSNVAVEIEGVPGGKTSVEVTDITGKKIITANTTDNRVLLDVSNIASGVYLVSCYNNGIKVGTTRLVKE